MAKLIIVENKGTRIVSAPIISEGVPTDTVRFMTGINFIDAKDYAEVATSLKYKFVAGEKECFKLLHIDKDSKALKCSVDFKDIPMEKAEGLIKGVYDVKTLKMLRSSEVRDSIRAKLADQIEAVENYTVDKSPKDNA